MAPIVEASSLDLSKMYALSRYGKGDGEDYLNCPLSREGYEAFMDALLAGETVPIKDFEKGIYFEGCLPIEVMAERGRETLRHGPMKPMGLPDPKTGRNPWAVVQLRQDDLAKEHYNLVGFQTKLKIPEQQRVFRMIPGLENAVFARYGMLHRNTYIHAPAHIDRFFRMRREPRIFFAGQITGVEGYVESAATGLAVGLTLSQMLEGREPVPVPYTTAIGSLARHCSERPPSEKFEPMNVTFGLIEDSSHSPVRDKQVRRQQLADRALGAIGQWKSRSSDPASSYRRGGPWAARAGQAPPLRDEFREGVHVLTWQDIEAARKRLAGIAHRTPVLTSRQFDEAAGARVFFKAENLQRGGAFKFRGAYNKIKAETERGKVDAVVAFSSGNHAQAVALVCRLLGIRATVVMPDDAPQAKIDGTRGYGAEVVLYDRASQSRDDLAEQICRERGAVLVPPFDDELVMAGQATGAVELLEDVGRSRRDRRAGVGRRPARRLGHGGPEHAARASRSTAPSPRTRTTRSARSPRDTASRSPRTRRSPTACACPRRAS